MPILTLSGAVVSVVGGMVSILVAAWNVHIKRVERREDKIVKRPYLIIDSMQIQSALAAGTSMPDISSIVQKMPLPFDLRQSTPASISISIRNNGARPASDVMADINMYSATDHALSCFPPLKLDSANPLATGMQITLKQLWSVPSTPGKQWIVVTLSFADVLLGQTKSESMKYYYEWPGVPEESVILADQEPWSDLIPLSKADRDILERRIAVSANSTQRQFGAATH